MEKGQPFNHDQPATIFNHKVRPLEVSMDQTEKADLARSTVTTIDRILLEAKLDFTETTRTIQPIELDNTLNPLPDWEVRSVIRHFYNRAHVSIKNEMIQGQRQLTQAMIHLFDENAPELDPTTLFILADETTSDAELNPSDPDFYLTVPSIEMDGNQDVIPLDYKNLIKVLSELTNQANLMASFESTDRDIPAFLDAIITMSPDREIAQEATYRVPPEPETGHSVVEFSRTSRLTAGAILPTSSRYVVNTMTNFTISPSGYASTQCSLDINGTTIMPKVGVEYVQTFDNHEDISAHEALLGITVGQWQTEQTLNELESYETLSSSSKPNNRFGRYITLGLSSVENIPLDEVEESRIVIQEQL